MWWEAENEQKNRIEKKLRDRKYGRAEEKPPEPVVEATPIETVPEAEPTPEEKAAHVIVVDNSEAVLQRMDKLLDIVAGQQQLLEKIVEQDPGNYRVVNNPLKPVGSEHRDSVVMPTLKGVDSSLIDTSDIEIGIGGAGKDVTEGASNKNKLANLRKMMKE
jgi:hypothetical protein